jgi:hypothetical protein
MQRCDPRVQQGILHTLAGDNILRLSDAVSRIDRVHLRCGGVDYPLRQVEAGVDMAEGYGFRGRPGFFQLWREQSDGRPGFFQLWREQSDLTWVMQLWPIPDAAYELSVGVLFDEPGATVGYTGKPDAAEKAMALLQNWLTPAQRACFRDNRHFMVVGSASKKKYRIDTGQVFNVHLLDEAGTNIRNLCFVPDNTQCAGDVMLAQKIMLETDEDHALQIANKQPLLPAA